MTEMMLRLQRLPSSGPAWYGAAAVAALIVSLTGFVAPLALKGGLALVAGVAFLIISYRRPELGIVGLVGAAALDITGRLVSIGGIAITVYQAAVFVFVCTVALRLYRREVRWRPTVADVPLALLLGFAAAAIPGAIDVRESIVQFISMVSSAVLLYLVVLSIDRPKQAVTVVWGTLGIAAMLGVLAVLERFGIYSIGPVIKLWSYGIRVTATFKDPNVFGSFLICALGLSLPLLLQLRKWKPLLIALAGMGLALIALLLTFSRGAWVAFIVAFLVAFVLSRVPFTVKATLLVGSAFAVVVFFAVYVDPLFIQKKILGVGDNRSALSRVYMGIAALEIFRDHPMGVGLGNYPLIFPYYRPAFILPRLVQSHTAYLTVLVETGVFGLIGFMWLILRVGIRALVTTFRAADAQLQALSVGALAALTALLVQSLTYSFESSKFLWLTFGLCLAVARMHGATKEETS